MCIDPEFVELTADVLENIFYKKEPNPKHEQTTFVRLYRTPVLNQFGELSVRPVG